MQTSVATYNSEIFLEERNNTWNTPFPFNGKELDEETGLYYYGARYYNPKTSQFLSTDRYAEKYPDASPYQYCLNNPVNALEINGDSITVANNPTSIGDVNSLVSANNQQYITFTGDGSFSQVGLNFGDKSQEDINNLLSSDEGLSLLNDVINASENYLYEASEIALLRDEAGNRKGVAMFMDSNGVVNASNGVADSNGAHTFRPASGYDGHVVLSIDGSWNEVNSSGTAIVSKSRSSMVFHEIAESYERTTNRINYHGSGSNRGAHSRAVSRENSWHGKSQSPGGIAPNGYSNPNTMRTHGMILNSINNHYLNSGNGLR